MFLRQGYDKSVSCSYISHLLWEYPLNVVV